jgi:hypothetical protein
MDNAHVRLRNPLVAAFLAWMVPGLGHYYQGRKGKAILYAACILGLYFTGMALAEFKVVYWRWINPLAYPEKFCLHYFGQFWMGLLTLPALIQGTLKYYGHDSILWGFLAEPPQVILNGLHPRLGKLVEMGTIYTTVAGLLNVLAIYDAYEGPAFQDSDEESQAESPAKELAGLGERSAEATA